VHTTRSGVMQILSKFCHNKHLTRYMAPYIHTVLTTIPHSYASRVTRVILNIEY